MLDSRLYVITPTGDREDAFTLCIKYLNSQTVKPYLWIIVDDGVTDAVSRHESEIAVPHTVIKLQPITSHSLCRNLRVALSHVPDDAAVCVMEDDDWYPRNYIEEMSRLLASHPYVGLDVFNTYNVPTRRYRIIAGDDGGNNAAMHGTGYSGGALKLFKQMLEKTDSWTIDTEFSLEWDGDRIHNKNAIPIHIVGFGRGRAGTTPSHYMDCTGSEWNADLDCRQLHKWIGDDVRNYANDSRKIYIFSNVGHRESERIYPDPDDLLVFFGSADNLDFYSTHDNKVVYHREPSDNRRDVRLCVRNEYVFDAGNLSIPEDVIDDIMRGYVCDNATVGPVARRATTCYIVSMYMSREYPLRDIVLVNFGLQADRYVPSENLCVSSYENTVLSRFKRVFTSDMAERARLQVTPSELAILKIFNDAGCDQMTRHAYSEVYDRALSRFRGSGITVVCVCSGDISNLYALSRALYGSHVFGIGVGLPEETGSFTVVNADPRDRSSWSKIPKGVDLVIDDGTHILDDIIRCIPVYLDYLAPGGSVIIEDLKSDEDAEVISSMLPGSVLYKTPPTSNYGDDRIIVYDRDSKPCTLRAVSDFEKRVNAVFSRHGSDRVTRHDYGTVYAEVLSIIAERANAKTVKIAEIGGFNGSGLSAIHELLPDSMLYGISQHGVPDVEGVTLVDGDGYSSTVWDRLPGDFDLIIEDGTHREDDIIRGLPIFLSHLCNGGFLVVEDIPSDSIASSIVGMLPGAICYNTTDVSEFGDDRILVYEKR